MEGLWPSSDLGLLLLERTSQALCTLTRLPDGELDSGAGEGGRGSPHLPLSVPAPCFRLTPSSELLLPLPSPPLGFRGGQSWLLTVLTVPSEASGLWNQFLLFSSVWWRRRGRRGSKVGKVRLCQDPGLLGWLPSRGVGLPGRTNAAGAGAGPPAVACFPGLSCTSGFARTRVSADEEVTGEPESFPTEHPGLPWAHGEAVVGIRARWPRCLHQRGTWR